MKPKFLKLSTVVLLLMFIGTSCQKDELDYDPDSIIGKWEWLYSVAGDATAIYFYPEKGQSLTIEFEQDSSLIFKENGISYSETVFSISEDTLNYNNNNLEYIFVYRISGDTLKLTNPFLLGTSRYYKRKNKKT